MQEEELSKIFPFWEKLTKKQKDFLCTKVKRERWTKGHRIFSYDGSVGCFYIKSGSIGAFLMGENDVETELYRVTKENICVVSFGAACGKNVQDVAFQVLSKYADIYSLAQEDMEFLFSSSSVFEIYIVRSFAEKVPHLIESIGQRDYYSLDKKIAGLLLSESSRLRSNVLHLTHAQIASKIGSARESVTRKIKKWEEEELISCIRGQITLINKEKLKKF